MQTKINPKIIEYWQKVFAILGKEIGEEAELVDAMLSYHQQPKTPANITKCLNKIFKDEYRNYLLYESNHKRLYQINESLLNQKGEAYEQ